MAIQPYVDRVDFTPPLREEWMDDAACVDIEDKSIFFPEKGQNARRDWVDPREICNTCPVRMQCLIFALKHETSDTRSFGIFGGLSGRERAALRQRMTSKLIA